jgi:tRNA A37 threonylcarbamoyladenosine modification protein TsaB
MLLGVYKDDVLVQSVVLERVASKELPTALKRLFDQYDFSEFIYVNTPGSFMAIKITYVTLKTFSLLMDIPLKAVEGFAFNDNRPIKAIGLLHFVKENGTITTKKFDKAVKQEYSLPQSIHSLQTYANNTPEYEIPAV